VLFAPDPRERLDPAYIQFVLGRLGISGERLLRPREPLLFERLWCPLPALQLSRIYQTFDAPHVRAAEAWAESSIEPPDRPVYLSRSGLSADLRKPRREEELERRLEAEGYRIVRPETLGLLEQMAIFNSDHPVVGLSGSAMHTVLFRKRPEGARVATLFPDKIAPRFVMVDTIKGSRALYAKCLHGDPVANYGDDRTFSIDCDLAMAQLDAAGFFSR
jgi:hypothetical protein